jgi:hypothetical protein
MRKDDDANVESNDLTVAEKVLSVTHRPQQSNHVRRSLEREKPPSRKP